MTTEHMNLRWTLADMDRLMERASRGATDSDLAFEFDVSTAEIRRLAERNNFFVRRHRLPPRLPPVTMQRDSH